MSRASRVKPPLTLGEFLRLPEIDEQPYLEYIDGKIEAKVSPQKKHSLIQSQLMRSLDDFAKASSLGLVFPELRCTFSGRSLVPDVVFLLAGHIEVNSSGVVVDETLRPPDIHIEIGSPGQPAKRNRERLLFSTAHGCPLGWFIDPERERVEVYRPDRPAHRLPDDGTLEGDPVLPGYRLPVAQLFGWLKPFVLPPPGGAPLAGDAGP
jgi:Uma2 family endonuclease